MEKALLLVGMLILSLSCIKDVDFKQHELSRFMTPMNIALINLNLTQDNFLNSSGNEIIYQKLYLTGLGGALNETKKDSLSLTTHFSHTFDRDVKVSFTYRDKNHDPLPISDSFIIDSDSSSPHTIIHTGEAFDHFAEANWIFVSIRTIPSLPVTPLTGSFNMHTTLGLILEVEIPKLKSKG